MYNIPLPFGVSGISNTWTTCLLSRIYIIYLLSRIYYIKNDKQQSFCLCERGAIKKMCTIIVFKRRRPGFRKLSQYTKIPKIINIKIIYITMMNPTLLFGHYPCE